MELGNASAVAARLDDDEKGVILTDTPGGPQQMTFVSESGLYTVLLRSDKPRAQPFRRWVTREVLPSIRKHGCYPPPATQGSADAVLAKIEAALAALRSAQQQREAELAGGDVMRRLTALEAQITGNPVISRRKARRQSAPRFKDGELRDLVLGQLKANPEGIRGPDLADAIGAHEDCVRTSLHRLKMQGLAFKKGWRWFAVSATGAVEFGS